jgi:hypothetical protein
MVRKSAALLVALAWSFTPARAAVESSAHWKHDNPFCGVLAAVAPLADGTRYGLALFAEHGTTLAAHVTLVSDTDAYDVVVPDTDLFGPLQDRQVEPVIVTLPSTDKIEYYFVDSYSLDGGQSVSCPSYVFPIGDTISDWDGDDAVIAARHLQSIAKLPCGRLYRPAETGRDVGGIIGLYGNRPLSASYRVYVDSVGRPVREELVESSGVEGVDSTALGTIQGHWFVPAQFLCTPVVGELRIRMDYVP